MTETFLDGKVVLHAGDSREVLASLPDNSIDSVVTDPPYALVSITKRFGKPGSAPAKDVYGRGAAGFMGKQWDTGDVAFDPAFWAEVLRVVKPGGHVVAFSGTRTYHRLASAIEDAGWEIRDQLAWAYGSGFPKSHDVSKGIDKAAGAERRVVGSDKNFGKSRLADGKAAFGDYAGTWDITEPATPEATQWSGWGTALKPAWEPICLARKPLVGTVASNVLQHGTGAINVDGCRVATDDVNPSIARRAGAINHLSDRPAADTEAEGRIASRQSPEAYRADRPGEQLGRWPANLIHDGSPEVLAAFPDTNSTVGIKGGTSPNLMSWGNDRADASAVSGYADSGSAARFFYTAKADAEDRLGFKHPTIKPLDLMQWLVRLVTPKGGTVLDPFAGTGTTGEAAWREGMRAVLIEREPEYQDYIRRRMELALGSVRERKTEVTKRKDRVVSAGPLFGDP